MIAIPIFARIATLHEMQSVYSIHDALAMNRAIEAIMPKDGDDGVGTA